jgi:hypothetical protein
MSPHACIMYQEIILETNNQKEGHIATKRLNIKGGG